MTSGKRAKQRRQSRAIGVEDLGTVTAQIPVGRKGPKLPPGAAILDMRRLSQVADSTVTQGAVRLSDDPALELSRILRPIDKIPGRTAAHETDVTEPLPVVLFEPRKAAVASNMRNGASFEIQIEAICA